ncbi:MAG: RNA-binding S4 domain-containing protein [Gracilibacteraceae bacterium]|jgi:ribosomal 50S subunit-recycling heat shock protein|nr:RNA-binding S4 domain-containing protein [Gracilibacteraceae bacterium]
MRLDKYLKVSRLIKRRSVAKEVCEGDKISVNGRTAKPAAEVKAGDLLTLNMRGRRLEVRILATPEFARAEEAASLYEVLREEKNE